MNRYIVRSIFSLAFALSARAILAITIDTVPVGDVGNPNDPATGNLYGGVNYAYNIGKYEVTVGQYTAFLNAVAATDTYGLYNPNMATDLNIAGIAQSCSPNCTYSVIGSPNHPVTFVSWGDAARFANWLHNGQPTGAEDTSTTEDGAYTLNGATSIAALMGVTRHANAKWFIPTENEWYKAAYYQRAAAGGDPGGYWAYPMKTNSTPNSAPAPGATAPDPTRVGNFYAEDGTANGYDNGFAVTGSTSYSSTQNYLTDVGAYSSSPSYYGTFDQGGNVSEWDESRSARGGSWFNAPNFLQASIRDKSYTPTNVYSILGFRVASSPIPEPTSVTLCVAGMLMLAIRSRRKKQRLFCSSFSS
jgi:sulfatase modifying factor 1